MLSRERNPMNTQLSLSGQDDVYSDGTNAGANSRLQQCTFRITVEHSPTALARVFGLLSTLAIVPAASRSTRVNDRTIDISLEFHDIPSSAADRLGRKINQLTEMIAIETA